MFSYEPLWETMKRRNATTYTLRTKGQVSPATIKRLRENRSVTIDSVYKICNYLKCDITDVVRFTLDDENY